MFGNNIKSDSWRGTSMFDRDALVAQVERTRREYEFAVKRLNQLDAMSDIFSTPSTEFDSMSVGGKSTSDASVCSQSYPLSTVPYSYQQNNQNSVYLGLNDDQPHNYHPSWHRPEVSVIGDNSKLSSHKKSSPEFKREYSYTSHGDSSHWLPKY